MYTTPVCVAGDPEESWSSLEGSSQWMSPRIGFKSFRLLSWLSEIHTEILTGETVWDLFRPSWGRTGESGKGVSEDINETRLAMLWWLVVYLELSRIQSLKRILDCSHALYCRFLCGHGWDTVFLWRLTASTCMAFPLVTHGLFCKDLTAGSLHLCHLGF